MGERDATQAAVLIRASSDVQDKMTSQITAYSIIKWNMSIPAVMDDAQTRSLV
jgi:hypothetical protein